MKKVIVTTTIYPPTEAIEKLQAMKDWDLVVVGDLKTPADYRLTRGIYVSPAEQEKYDPALSKAIGWNCIQRRNFGFLWAKDLGADVVAVVDDDNIPLDGWGQDLLVGKEVEVDYYETDLPAFDPLGATNHGHLWHRGYPLQLLPMRQYGRKSRKTVRVDIQADLWNGDPDVDAICRLEHAPKCEFDPSAFPMAANKMGPFDSQNTFLRPEVLGDYFVMPHVGRMDDIWAGYLVQAKGFRVVYSKPSVFQDRHPRDLLCDLRGEYLGYENNLRLVEDVSRDPDSILAYLPGRTAWAFELYRRHFRSTP
jgi:hypothetical protein